MHTVQTAEVFLAHRLQQEPTLQLQAWCAWYLADYSATLDHASTWLTDAERLRAGESGGLFLKSYMMLVQGQAQATALHCNNIIMQRSELCVSSVRSDCQFQQQVPTFHLCPRLHQFHHQMVHNLLSGSHFNPRAACAHVSHQVIFCWHCACVPTTVASCLKQLIEACVMPGLAGQTKTSWGDCRSWRPGRTRQQP